MEMAISHGMHESLRSSTKALHQQLDSLEALLPLKGKGLNRDTYKTALIHMYSPHAFLEQKVARSIQKLDLDYDYQQRANLFRENLIALGADITVFSSEDRLAAHVDQVCSIPEIIGYLYLLEGSKLGSDYIARRLAKSALWEAEFSAFSCCADQRSEWDKYWLFVNNYIERCGTEGQIIEAAENAFRFYICSIENEELALTQL
ncbi:biliverdin-producing heme oxygenase [Neptuniibacter sp.]|uniref:biliverdin-producing heme oxygenase n=1 Tax=Neptuniibacter sp. TaxID=1962643 RepID=UPI002616E00F|nr:biliverdin-producing heme oxygenase [Neptuniibacter sp.]MCP4595487.1 biliverdin-producing heme oxygenase [Neptuniibacter sp.]